MTFAAFKTKVLADAFPLGVPENLTESIDQYVISALIEVQRWVKCTTYRHEDVIPACNTFWHCGTTVVTAPRGKILRVYTAERTEEDPEKLDWCHPIVLAPVTMQELRRWQATFRLRWNRDFFEPSDSGRSIPMGFDVPTLTSDSVSGRALTGVYALDALACRLHVAPWLQTTEVLVIEWQGIKRTWTDDDPVSDDNDFRRLVRLFVELEYGRKWAAADLITRERSWAEALSDMMSTCEAETKLHGEPRTAAEADQAAFGAFVAPSTVAPPPEAPEDEVTIGFVGDYGDPNRPEAKLIADALQGNEPDWIITLGNNKVDPTSAPICMRWYNPYLSKDRLRAALGNSDLDDGALGNDVTTLANNPGNGRYYAIKIASVTVFVINSGYDSLRAIVEPDGSKSGSHQWQEVVAAIVRDTSRWKIVVVHHPPHSSSVVPVETGIGWVSELPVHLVLSGHSHNYERLTIGGRIHVVAGTGGMFLDNFAASPSTGSEIRIRNFGYLLLHASCEGASLEFIAIDGTTADTVVLPNAV